MHIHTARLVQRAVSYRLGSRKSVTRISRFLINTNYVSPFQLCTVAQRTNGSIATPP